MRLTDRLCRHLREIRFTADTYAACFHQAAEALESAFRHDDSLAPADRAFLNSFLESMRVWIQTVARVRR